MQTYKPKIFISYSHEDKAVVKRLEAKLKAAGADVWVDYDRVRGGVKLPEKINEALEWCDTLLLVWSDAARQSDWVKDEWLNAFSLRKVIIPCILDNSQLPAILANRTYVDFHNVGLGIEQLLYDLSLAHPTETPLFTDSMEQVADVVHERVSIPFAFRMGKTIYGFFRIKSKLLISSSVTILALVVIMIIFYRHVNIKKENSTKLQEQSNKTDTTVIAKPSTKERPSQLKQRDIKPPSAILIKQAEGGDFYISKYEVTNEEYMKFVEETGYRPPLFINEPNFKNTNQPVVGVSWDDAVAYCNWLSEKTRIRHSLPTDDEWRHAAYGVEQRQYPWGNEPPSRRANYSNSTGKPATVGTYSDGATPDSVFDMAGNVWEWCDTWFDFAQTERVIRGGSWKDSADKMRIGFRDGERPDENKRNDMGFRVVRSVR